MSCQDVSGRQNKSIMLVEMSVVVFRLAFADWSVLFDTELHDLTLELHDKVPCACAVADVIFPREIASACT